MLPTEPKQQNNLLLVLLTHGVPRLAWCLTRVWLVVQLLCHGLARLVTFVYGVVELYYTLVV